MIRQTFGGHALRGARSPRTPRLATAAVAAAVFLAAACTPTPGPSIIVGSNGSVVVDWTIRGGKDPADCAAFGATSIHVSLVDTTGAPPMEFVQDCTAFATTIDDVAPDTYAGSVELLDASGRARTTSVNLAPFDVRSGRTVTVAVDFPASSFF